MSPHHAVSNEAMPESRASWQSGGEWCPSPSVTRKGQEMRKLILIAALGILLVFSEVGGVVSRENSGMALAGAGERSGITLTNLDFGTALLGESTTKELTVHNAGTAVLEVNSIASDNAQFGIDSPTGSFTVVPGGQQVVTVRFRPTAVGSQNGELSIASNDPDAVTVPIQLQGLGVGVPNISVAPDQLDFGTVTVGQSLTLTLTVSNTGTGDLRVDPITSTNPRFSVVSPTGPFTVAPREQQLVTVQFRPTTAGGQSAELRIASNDADAAIVSAQLQGSGTAPKPRPCPLGQKCCECCDPDAGCPAVCVPNNVSCASKCAAECRSSHRDCLAGAMGDSREIRICIQLLRSCLRGCGQ